MSEFLSPDEIRELTQRARLDAQAVTLGELGIPFRAVAKRLLVSRSHVRDWLAGKPLTPSRAPDISAIR